MRPSHLLFLFTLFHHHHKTEGPTKKDVAAFVNRSEYMLHTYKDGSVDQWLEDDLIENIEQDIDYLRRNPKGETVMEMEVRINDELDALQQYDLQVQKDIIEHHPTVNQS